MKFVAAIVASLLMLNCAYADNHSEPNYSKFQSNFYFTCPQPAACVSAFEKMLASPDIAEKNFEVSLMALSHNGWDESTHMVSFILRAPRDIWRQARHFHLHPLLRNFWRPEPASGSRTNPKH